MVLKATNGMIVFTATRTSKCHLNAPDIDVLNACICRFTVESLVRPWLPCEVGYTPMSTWQSARVCSF